MIIYIGDAIRTTDGFDPFTTFNGKVAFWLPDGAIAATLFEDTRHGSYPFGVNLDAGEWELVPPPDDLHEEHYARRLFDD